MYVGDPAQVNIAEFISVVYEKVAEGRWSANVVGLE